MLHRISVREYTSPSRPREEAGVPCVRVGEGLPLPDDDLSFILTNQERKETQVSTQQSFTCTLWLSLLLVR
jgi:hypothetical protein